MKILRKVWERTSNGQKLVTVPKKSNIKAGDLVEIILIRKADEREQIRTEG
jgi:hypothetical protein